MNLLFRTENVFAYNSNIKFCLDFREALREQQRLLGTCCTILYRTRSINEFLSNKQSR